MSSEYDHYLDDHRKCVQQAYDFLVSNAIVDDVEGKAEELVRSHDLSKFCDEEYDAYDQHFYGVQSEEVEQAFLYAFLHHLHNNPHHFQYWVLIQGVNKEHNEEVLEMPYEHVVEMVCDWWSFSWSKYNESGNLEDLLEVLKWYKKSKDNIKLHPLTRDEVESLLFAIETCIGKQIGF